MSRVTAPSQSTVENVLSRDGQACARCGKTLVGQRGLDWSIHHRVPRGMGGTKRKDVNSAANLIALCGSGVTGCHGWIEQNRAEGIKTGFLVSKFGPVAAKVPVWHHRYGQVFLLPDGGVSSDPVA